MIKLRELNLRTIRKMTMRHRLQAINQVNRSALSYTMFSMMTPTQFAELFPRYYRERSPDIQGFMNALPSSLTQAQQKAREAQLAQTASGSAAGSDFNSRGYVKEYKDQMTRERSAHVGGRGRNGPPPATLSPEQDRAFTYIQSGDMDAGSDIMKKNFGGLSNDELSSIGIKKITKEGKEYYSYVKPEMTREQAIEQLKHSGSKSHYSAAEVAALVRNAGGTVEEATTLGAISVPESQGKVGAWNGGEKGRQTGDDSHGLFQINLLDSLGPPRRKALGLSADGSEDYKLRTDPNLNAKAALMLYRGQLDGKGGWQHWTTWKNNKHLAFMDDAARGANDPSSYGTAEKARGPNGEYSDEQIKSVMDRFPETTNKAQRQKYAEILRNHGISPEKVQTAYDSGVHIEGMAVSKFSVDSGGWVQPNSKDVHIKPGNERQCVTLSRAFNNELPNVGIGGWKVSRNDSAIQPGVVVATNMYNSGRASEPKQGFHTGVALTKPNENGDFWMLDQSSGGPAKVRMQNVNNYNYHGTRSDIQGNFFGIVNGNTKQSKEAIAMALNNPGNMPREAVEQLRKDYDAIVNNPKVAAESDVRQVQQASRRPESDTAPKDTQNIPEGAHVHFDQNPGRVDQKSETKVTVSEKKPEVKKEPPKPEEPKIPEGSHVHHDLNPGRVEQKSQDKVTVTPPPEKKAETKPEKTAKVEPPKETPKVAEAPKPAEPQKTAEAPKPAEPQKVAENKPTEKPKTPTQTAAKGGKFNADTKNLHIAPIGGLSKGGMTDTAVLMAGDRPVSTLNPNKETVSAKNNQVSIQPVGKEANLNPPAPPPQINGTPEQVTEVARQTAPAPQKPSDNNRDPNLIDTLLDMSRPVYRSPSAMRAFNQAHFAKSGEGVDDNHYSIGNANA